MSYSETGRPALRKAALLLVCVLVFAMPADARHWSEKLRRAAVSVPAQTGGRFISWRMLDDDPSDITFDVVRGGKVVARDLRQSTCYIDPDGKAGDSYRVVAKLNGAAADTSDVAWAWSDAFTTIQLQRPNWDSSRQDDDPRRPRGWGNRGYTPNDCSVGDLDGDGQYELVVKWEPPTSRDNSHRGYCDEVYLDAYRLDGTLLWRINLGKNIRAGAHYTQFMVYDFDGDGKAELICKTAPGTIDGTGRYVSQAADDPTIQRTDNQADLRNNQGYVLDGEELLSVFDGQTGRAVHTIYYRPNRAGGTGGAPSGSDQQFWGDGYGNRCDRYLACVAHLDGTDHRPSAVMCRGYYTRAYLWAVDFDGRRLSTRWLHESTSRDEWDVKDGNDKIIKSSKNGKSLFGQGNHSIAVGDVDRDGFDEIIFGSGALDHDGTLLYSTGLGHGDALHLADLDPRREGLEVMMVHEAPPYGCSVRDAATGELIFHEKGNKDTGRGLAADIDSSRVGHEFWSLASRNVYSIDGTPISDHRPSVNFRIYWDGDLQDELLDGTRVWKWNGDGTDLLMDCGDFGNSSSCNSSKQTPCLQADILGDWREELIFFDRSDPSKINIFTTNVPTPHRVPALMTDHLYRLSVVWQNVGYNQPPHAGRLECR